MVTTNNEKIAETVNSLRNHGASISEEERHHGFQPYVLPDFDLLGFNYRMTDLQGAVGIVQLSKLDRFIEERQEWANYYNQELTGIPWLHTPVVPMGYKHGWQAYVCYVEETKAPMSRNEIMKALYSKGIHTRPGTHAVHMLGLYRQQLGFTPEDYPGARNCDQYTMAIPLHNRMTSKDYEFVVKTIKSLDGR